jgi:murein DD-endopeptidase MepM/ murein hydrolase activator NlpD
MTVLTWLLIGLGGAIASSVITDKTTVQAVESGSSNVAVSGTWRGSSFPVENFQGYTSPFGYRRSPDGASNQEFHKGLDLAAPDGSYIRNWWAGKIVEVSDNTACGTSIIIQSGEWRHIYCHMKGHVETISGQKYLSDRSGGLQLAEGQVVPAGARIGRVGMSGRTTGPHLHWGLKYAGQYVDPALVLRAMYAEQAKYSAVQRGIQ